jgi:hypothetical protein
VVLGARPNSVTYAFVGTAEGDEMRGRVDLGEFGVARWVAGRAVE